MPAVQLTLALLHQHGGRLVVRGGSVVAPRGDRSSSVTLFNKLVLPGGAILDAVVYPSTRHECHT